MSYIPVETPSVLKVSRQMSCAQGNKKTAFALRNAQGFTSPMEVDHSTAVMWLLSNHSNSVSVTVEGGLTQEWRCRRDKGVWVVETRKTATVTA